MCPIVSVFCWFRGQSLKYVWLKNEDKINEQLLQFYLLS
jgi:hypothetical protein